MDTPRPAPAVRARPPRRLARTIALTLLAFTLVPLLTMAAAAYVRTRDLLFTQLTAEIDNRAATATIVSRANLNARNDNLAFIGTNQEFIRYLDQLLLLQPGRDPSYTDVRQQVITAFNGNNFSGPLSFNQFFVILGDGRIVAASSAEWEGVSLAGSAPFEQIRASENITTALYDLRPLYPDQLVLLTIERIRPTNAPGGALLIGITEPTSLINSLLTPMTVLYPGARAFIALPDGRFMEPNADRNGLSLFEATERQQRIVGQELINRQTASSATTLDYLNPSGEAVLANVQWIANLGVGVITEVPQSNFSDQILSLAPFSALLIAFSLLAAGVAIWISATTLVRPIVQLTDTTRSFAGGDWQKRSTLRRGDEIGQLSNSFNTMADQLSNLYRSLEQRVEERTRQIRTAAEVAQDIIASPNLDLLLSKAVRLISERFNYYHAALYLIDPGGKFAVLRAAHGPAAEQMLARGYRLEVGSESIVGWVSANNRPRVTGDVSEDPVHLKYDLLPETRSEAGIPISVGSLVLGVLDVQSASTDPFDSEAITVLQTLANQLAAAIQNTNLAATAQVNVQEIERMYRASHRLAQARTETELFQTLAAVLQDSPYLPVVFVPGEDGSSMRTVPLPAPAGQQLPGAQQLDIRPDDINQILAGELTVVDLSRPTNIPHVLLQAVRQLGIQTVAFMPVMRGNSLAGLVSLGARQSVRLAPAELRPYVNLIELSNATLGKIAASSSTEKRLSELQAISTASKGISAAADMDTLYRKLSEQVRQTIGEYNFLLALYEKDTDSIRIPYMIEDGNVTNIDAFPLGEGLSSILIRTREPLLLVENTEQQATRLGAKVVGRPARSWMGAPLVIGEEPIGAMIIQDPDREHAFDEDDLRFFTTLASQVSGAIYNVQLLEESRQRALQLQTAAEIARDIGGSLNLDELLLKAVSLVRERFKFYHAAIFLIDPLGEYALIREATGEAGAQMKRTGHKLAVGSKSIVGYVAGRGEPLVVNDTTRDATYYPNPLLPDTRAEAGIPIKLGDRTLGIMDVQSTRAYAFGTEDVRTLQTLADQLAVAIANSELFAETQEHLSQHRLLHHITTSAASGSTLEEALESAVNGLQVTLGGDRVSIMLLNKEKSQLEVRAAVGYSAEDIFQVRIPLGTGITGWVAQHRRLQRVDNVAEDPRYIPVSSNTRSELAIPITYRNELLGVLNVESEHLAAYNEHDEELLGTLGSSLAAVIANARLLQQVRRQAERERLLYEVTSKIRRSTDVKTILATTASELTRTAGVRRAQIKITPPEDDKNPGKSK